MKTLTIETQKSIHPVSPILYGIFFEDINYAGDGGLYAELIANRSFEYYDKDDVCDKHKMCWEPVGDISFEIGNIHPLSDAHPSYAKLSGSAGCGIRNIGFCGEGFSVKEGQSFRFSCYARNTSLLKLTARLVSREGEIFSEKTFSLVRAGHEWSRYKLTLTAEGNCKNACLELLLAEEGSVCLDLISLFPAETFLDRPNGMRKDLAEMLAALSPKFMRFPGGCIVEGRSFENMYNWKETIGPLYSRRTNWNRWQLDEYQIDGRSSADYFQSYGLGFYEYFQFCEDIGAKPVPVLNAGMTCQWHEGLLVELEHLDRWIQDILDLIEFANGSVESTWGAKRAAMGHPEPFNLEYIGVGNEQWGEVYFERYEAIQKAVSEKYPDIRLITSAGWTSEGDDFELAYRWMRENKEKAYAVDEHFYKSPEWFLENIHRYDDYDRSLPKVFAGEYAAHSCPETARRVSNWKMALCEAAFLTGVEQNADHVVMSCYAPLFGRTGRAQWQPDLIWFDNDSAYGTPSYYVQQLYSRCTGTTLVEANGCDLPCSTTLSEDKRTLYVKLVNLSDAEQDIELQIDRPVLGGSLHELSGDLEAVNSHEAPTRISTRTCPLPDAFPHIHLKKYSVTVLELGI